MARRISWTNNSDGHDGTNIYRDTTIDPQNLPAPIATVGPAAQGATAEYIDLTGVGEQCYAVQDFEGENVSALSDAYCFDPSEPFDPGASIGDYTGGGVYAGTDTIGGADYHIISGTADSEVHGVVWKTSQTFTAGTDSDTDGLANTQAMEAAGLADHPAAAHCLGYAGGEHTDWHMPAHSQITLMYNNLAGHSEFADNVSSGDFTFASTEVSETFAWVRSFSSGTEGNSFKDNVTRRVRPIRRIPV